MSTVVGRLRASQERTYGVLMIIAGVVLWPLVALGLLGALASGDPKVAAVTGVYVFYGLAIWLALFVASGIYCAGAFGNMVMLSPEQFPHLHAMVVEGAAKLGMRGPPTAFLFNANGLFNAFARRFLGRRYLFLTAALLEASTDEQVRFVIGHELGHHAAGHLNPWMNALKLPGYVVPFLQPAYSRGREFTCDALGAHVSGDTPISQSALMMLGCGCARLNKGMNLQAFAAQEAQVPPVFGFIGEILRSHPRLTRRLRRLESRGVQLH